MEASIFQSNLHQLNPKLRIYCGDDNSKPASLYYVVNNEEITLCGVDKNELPKYAIWDNKGHIVKSGWYRVLKLLINRKLINKSKAQNLFNDPLYGLNSMPNIEQDEIWKKIQQAEHKGKWHKDDLAEIGSKL